MQAGLTHPKTSDPNPPVMIDPATSVDFKDYFSAASASFERAFARGGRVLDLQIGDQRWSIRHTATQGVERYLRAFSHLHLPTDAPAKTTLAVCLWDYEASGEAPPAPLWKWARRLPHSQESSFENGRYIAVQSYNGFYFLLDRAERLALVWHQRYDDLPSYEFASPLRDLIELWFKPSAFIRLHGGAVGGETGGVLLVGKSGSGKSTTSLACLLAGIGYAGDDFVLVDSQQLMIHSLYNSGKVIPDNLFRLPRLIPHVDNLDMPADEKSIFYLASAFPEQMMAQFPLRATFVPSLTGRIESQFVPISPIQAMQALAPSTLMQEADPTPREFEKIAQIAKMRPCYRLDAGTDLDQLTKLIKGFLAHA